MAGIQTGGSQRAFDLYMKSKYLDQLHAGRGLTFATGTPISNTMVEMYTVQRYLDPQGLRDRGIEHFDGWAATFGEVVETMEISPDGKSMRPRARFARFNNLPELQQMFRSFTDVQTAQMLRLPTPKLRGGKPTVVACPMSPDQQYQQDQLVKRYDEVRCGEVDPRVDNALAITTDGRKLALDAQMLVGDVEDFEEGKINAMVGNIVRIYQATAKSRATQMVFCDLGVKPTPWGYSVYDTVIDKLVTRGIPSREIATMQEAQTDAKKQALFEQVRNGSVRILIGSTQKMGTGTNVQKRLIAMHHLDAPWKPAEVEQRDGRILRQGNENAEVEIFRYVTEGSFDSFLWQALETKAKFIGQVMTGSTTVRRAHDIGGQELSYAEVKAIASGNPAVLTLAEADAEVKRLAILKKNHTDEQFLARRNLKTLPQKIDEFRSRIDALEKDQATVAEHERARTEIDGRSVAARDVVDVLASVMQRLPQHVVSHRRDELGRFRGLTFGIIRSASGRPQVYLEGESYRAADLSRESTGARAILNRLERMATSYDQELVRWQDDLAVAEKQLEDYRSRLGEVFQHEEYVVTLTNLRDRLRTALSGMGDAGDEACTVESIAEETASLLASNNVAETPATRHAEPVAVTAAESVTARVFEWVGKAIESVNAEEGVAEEAEVDEVPVEAAPYDPSDTWSEATLPSLGSAENGTAGEWNEAEATVAVQRQLF